MPLTYVQVGVVALNRRLPGKASHRRRAGIVGIQEPRFMPNSPVAHVVSGLPPELVLLPQSVVVLEVLRQIEKHSGASIGGFFSAATLHTLHSFHLLQSRNGVDYGLTPMAEALLGSAPVARSTLPSPMQVQAATDQLRSQSYRASVSLSREHASAYLEVFTWRSMFEPPAPGQWCLVRLQEGRDAVDCYIGDLEGFPLEWREGPEGYGRYNVVIAWRPHVELPVS